MNICSHCETAHFLQITESSITMESETTCRIDETYHCTRCDGRGRYWFVDGSECVTGQVEIVEVRPTMETVE